MESRERGGCLALIASALWQTGGVFDIAVVGKANIDYLVRGPRLPVPGQSVNGDAFQEAPGGKGANQAVAAARLGAKVALIARVGRDARGDAVLAALHDERVDTRR